MDEMVNALCLDRVKNDTTINLLVKTRALLLVSIILV